MTRKDKWAKRPIVVRYYDFCNSLRMVAQGIHFDLPHEGARFVFHVPMPASWSMKRRKQFNGQPCRSAPDLDNYLKAVFDSLLPDDCMVWHIAGAEKRWAEKGAVEISIQEAAA